MSNISSPVLALCLFCCLVAACSSGGSSGDAAPLGTGPLPQQPLAPQQPSFTAGVYPSSDLYYAQCANPRSGIHPFNGAPYDDVQGTAAHEKLYVRSLLNELYFWSDDLREPSLTYAMAEYFARLIAPYDEFSGVQSLTEFLAFYEQGTEKSYGVRWEFAPATRDFHVALVAPTSPNANSVARGDRVLAVNGITLEQAVNNERLWNVFFGGLFPSSEADVAMLRIQSKATNEVQVLTLTLADVAFEAVPYYTSIDTGNGLVGYLLFYAHTQLAGQALFNALTDLRSQNISDLVVDLRFNGGGLISVASQLAYMVAGDAATADKAFMREQFNSKFDGHSPFTGQPVEPMAFIGTLAATNQPLPVLDLPRVYVLTTGSTCSASEAFINGLRGIGVEVLQFGETTCGKPFGFYPVENCGTIFNFVMMQATNQLGFGDYESGFSPLQGENAGVQLPGCTVFDDMQEDLGSANENLLSAALYYRQHGSCPATTAAAPSSFAAFSRQPMPAAASGRAAPFVMPLKPLHGQ